MSRTDLIRVGGLVPLTTIDYPDHLSCVLFCQGCAWRCHYCHNPDLIPPTGTDSISWPEVLEFLRRRQGLLQAVVFSGGEATLQPHLAQAMQQVADLGFKIGLHTAGIKPSALAQALPWCDWVGFDVKAPQGAVDSVTQIIGSDVANWDSLRLLLGSGVDYECRTTVHWDLLNPEQLKLLAAQLATMGVRRWVIQIARNGNLLNQQLAANQPPRELEQLWQTLGSSFAEFAVREH